MTKLLLAGGGLGASIIAVPLLALLAVFGSAARPFGCTPGALAADADVPVHARPWVTATHAACPVLPAAWIAAVMAQESGFDPDTYADDVNGGTWGLFQLNAAVWADAYGAGWDADRNGNGRPDVRDADVHAAVAGHYLCRRLAGVRALRAAHPDWASTRDLSELDALIVAHNAGESRLASYPDIPAVTAEFVADVDDRTAAWSGCARAVPARSGPRGPGDAIAAGLALVGTREGWYRMCDRLVCRAYGYATSGFPTAVAHWQAMRVAGFAHPGDRCPPPGAFAYWDTGPGQAGHVVLVATRNGCDPHAITVVSNDFLDRAVGARGGVYHVTLARLESGFVDPARYLGWSAPVCAGLPLLTDPDTVRATPSASKGLR
ncbi:transglycosylase SLT domain-containing protein [Sporichthya polymorpha]|uniref:transglycosylase SLT domain-containing protein n=1 Tax=Sporichthya polymorpha TaxID=35751 RepID=UPI00036D6439|nr:transglycosylase SLT domain-containing protein [Sporichthya polymorpha]